MNWRRIIYIAVIIFVAAVIFRNIPDTKLEPPPKLLNQQMILEDFQNLEHPVYDGGNISLILYIFIMLILVIRGTSFILL